MFPLNQDDPIKKVIVRAFCFFSISGTAAALFAGCSYHRLKAEEKSAAERVLTAPSHSS